MSLKKWTKLDRKIKFNNSYWSYIIDKFKIEDGPTGEYHFVHTLGSSLIIPITSSKKILAINQYRYLLNRESIEFPCGSLKEGLTIEQNAEEELREETGYSARYLLKTGEFCPYNGVADEMCSVFIAEELFRSPLPPDTTEEFELFEFTVDEIDDLILSNKIWDGMTIAAWGLSKKKIIELLNEKTH